MGHHESLRHRVFGKKLGKLLLASITAIMLCMPLAPAFAMPQSLSDGNTENEPCGYTANGDINLMRT